ncbi:MAG: transcription-repair coupling factor [Phycisphaerae bacterium]|nr:transcription-repair coupling factor [Phycisphaerae bacterium]
MLYVFEGVLKNEQLREIAARLSPGRKERLAGVWGSAGPLVAAALGRIRKVPVLFIAAHLDDADEVADDWEVFTGSPAQLFPAWEVDIGSDHLNDEIAGERVRICNLLTAPPGQRDEPVDLIVAPVMALLQPVPSKELLEEGRVSLHKGLQLGPDALGAWLVDAGFEHVEQVDQQGQFARRGGIVDVLPPGVTRAVRVEFFGDEIESIRRFDLDTQRSTGDVDGFDLTEITAGRQTDPQDTTHLLSYLPPETIVCMIEPAEVAELAEQLYHRAQEVAEGLESSLVRFGAEQILAAAEQFAVVEMHRFTPKTAAGAVPMGVRSLERMAINTHEALGELEELSGVADVWVYCENPAERDRFFQLLNTSHKLLGRRVHVGIGHVHGGFYWPLQKLAVVGHHEIYRRYARVRRIRRVRAGRPIDSMLDLQIGDHVVHVAHGIARFDGLGDMERNGRKEEYLRLRFADSAVLHVPASRIDLVQKYIGARARRPALSKLGGAGWVRQKKRVAAAVRDLAAEMLQIQAMREAQPGCSFGGESEWEKQFTDEFIYTETEDQITAMQQIEADMAATRPTDRLLCGDVGYGKTELAMRSAFKVAQAGKQVAVLVPTTVLAAQHHRTFCERFADYPFEIEMLSRFRTASQQAGIIKRLSMGQIDVVIGTHRLLSKDVRFADLGLVIIDEEQRFGVAHKEHLKSMRTTVEVLTMTATPIPRTLHMALLGLRDISSLATPPLDRRAIYTEVCHSDDQLIRMAILRELNRQGQVFFVHNRVHSIESVADHVRKLVPEVRVEVAHGQMPEGRLEKVMLRLVDQEIDVLVCTSIIESGLDIPTANTMIIHDADRFGLAELHQLRGRVGRYKHRAYCYLLLPDRRTVTPGAARRLKAIEEFSDLGAGFQIAMRDLEIRGAGNILGAEQSGHIATVGYELYCQLLERAVRELRGVAGPVRRHVHVDLGIDVYIPKGFIPSERQRMEVYRRLANCHTCEELTQLGADLADAYGQVPAQVQTILDLAEIRILGGQMGIDSIVLMDPDVIFAVHDFAVAKDVFEGAAGSVRLPDERTVHWRPPKAYLEMPTIVNVLLKRLRGVRVPL